MFFQDALYGFTETLCKVRYISDKLNAKVVEQVNDTQELVMLNNFMHESDEYLLKKCLQERMSDVASWRWVLQDLEKRVDETISAIQHESDALHVVVERINDEIHASTNFAKPGALNPMIDFVEDAVMQELVFLRQQKKRFVTVIPQVEKLKVKLVKMKDRIQKEALQKCEAISVDEACWNTYKPDCYSKKKKKKKSLSLVRWERRCAKLKDAGINTLRLAVVTRQKIRAARVDLSIAAQAYGARVDSAIRRRLHANIIKLQELEWQRHEAVRDLKSLDIELETTEKSVLDTMDRQKVVEGRLNERTLRPVKEQTVDQVTYQLRMEHGKLRRFTNELRNNIDRIVTLQNRLKEAITHIDCYADDILHVVKLDRQRLQARTDDETIAESNVTITPEPEEQEDSQRQMDFALEPIQEEDENYPILDL
ncbi:PREDICTED: tektin-2-like [Papilio polytes]|uniref:tektin-2-like n=1 Tax=Papilio polytes TaxID=76194 RepID=UPI0006766E22|nr:PREDICTED: tektin-2-like [Papilio polytes]